MGSLSCKKGHSYPLKELYPCFIDQSQKRTFPPHFPFLPPSFFSIYLEETITWAFSDKNWSHHHLLLLLQLVVEKDPSPSSPTPSKFELLASSKTQTPFIYVLEQHQSQETHVDPCMIIHQLFPCGFPYQGLLLWGFGST